MISPSIFWLFSGCSHLLWFLFFTLVTLITLVTRGRDVRRSKNRSAPICSGSAARGFWQFHMISLVKKFSDALCLSDLSARPDQHRPSGSIWNPEGAQLQLWKPETRRMSLIMSWMSLNSWRRSRRKYVSEWQRRRLGKYQVTSPCGGPVFFCSPRFAQKGLPVVDQDNVKVHLAMMHCLLCSICAQMHWRNSEHPTACHQLLLQLSNWHAYPVLEEL